MKGYGNVPRVSPETSRQSRVDWRERAVCRGTDPEAFFPTAAVNTLAGRNQVAVAKAVCRGCPVKAECLAWALETGADAGYGVWGGLDADERRVLRRAGGYTVPPVPSDALRRAGEDMVAGATIQEVADRYGLTRNRAEQLSAEVRRNARRAGAAS